MCVRVCTSQKLWHGSYITAGARLITSGGAQWLIVGSSFLAGVLTLGHRASVLPHTHIVKVLLQCTPITLRPSCTHQHMHQIPSLPSSHLTPYLLLFFHLHSFASLVLLWLLFYLNPSPPPVVLTCSMAIYLVLASLHSTLPCLPVSFLHLFVQLKASESPKLYSFDFIVFKLCHFPYSCTSWCLICLFCL